LEGYGIEINFDRAYAAERRLKRVLHLDMEAGRAPEGSFQLLFDNPPYDQDDVTKRLEYKFLRETHVWLADEGLLVYIVPQPRIEARVARFLASRYHDIRIYRFPDPEYAAFKQVVVFGVKSPSQITDDALAERIEHACSEGELPILPEVCETPYALPAFDPSRKFFLRGSVLDTAELLRESLDLGAWHARDWQDWLTPTQEADVQPLMPLKRGHLAMLLAAGLMQNLLLARGDKKILVKGRTYKVQDKVETDDATIERDRFVTEITALDLVTGEVQKLNEPTALAGFLEEWKDELSAHVVNTYAPLYQFDYDKEPDVTATLNGLSKGRKLAGREETGLFEAQKHVAAALARRLRTHDYAILVGEMGVGKTTIASALASLRRLDAAASFPAIILCPPHLVKKWQREIEQIIPGAKGILCQRMKDVDAFFKTVALSPVGAPLFAIVSREYAKLGSGWRPAYRNIRRPMWMGKSKEVQFVATCPDCNRPITNGGAMVAWDVDWLKRDKRKCENCGSALWQLTHLNSANRGAFHDTEGKDETITLRYPLADYIARQYRNRFGLFIADEVHQLKGQSTDQGYAFGALIRACKKTVVLTGTIYGGRATSIFYILYRLSPEVRAQFGWKDAMRFAATYGILEQVTKHADDGNGHGVWSAKKRNKTFVRELPGCSPGLALLLIEGTAFISLADLGFELPPYEDAPAQIEMTPEMRDEYEELDSTLGSEMRARLGRGDMSLLGAYLQATLGQPNAPWREERVVDKKTGRIVASTEALPNGVPFPKEEYLLDLVRAEVGQGRGVLVYCRQTDTRDITQHLKELLAADRYRVAILTASVDTQKREEWVEKRVKEGVQVLISNPKLVETGLDLVAFPTIAFYEPDYNLYTMMQAARRSWRLGQTKPVKVYFVTYLGCMEARAMSLVANKWAAATLLNGDSVEGAIAQQVHGSDNLMAELARQALAGTKVDDLQDLFREKRREQQSADVWLGAAPPMILKHPTNGNGQHVETPTKLFELYGEGQTVVGYQMSLW
jgi:superfamily II DNA or RNA helicase